MWFSSETKIGLTPSTASGQPNPVAAKRLLVRGSESETRRESFESVHA